MVLAVGAVVFAGACGEGDGGPTSSPERRADEQDASCDVGARRKVPAGRGIVLACGKAPDGRRIEIRSWPDAGGPCLTIIGLPAGPRQCGRTPSESIPPRPAMTADAIVRITPTSRLELYGEARSAVRRVVVHFRLPGGNRLRRSAAIVRAGDAAALRAAQIREPFGYFIAFVPGMARHVVATGHDAQGAVVGRVRYDPIVDSLHPHNFIARELRRSTSR